MQKELPRTPGPIGVFDSGYGGLTILKEIRNKLPNYDFLYLGDNARAPYGTRSFDVVYKFTLQAVEKLFSMGCHLVILACNTASAKALRSIQQNNLPNIDPNRRVLGVIRPTVEILNSVSRTKHIGVMATSGTILSNSYPLEIEKISPNLNVVSEACPMWVHLVENGEVDNEGTNYFVKKHIENLFSKDNMIDTVLLGCTHYPILSKTIKKYTPSHINIISQGSFVANSLKDYLNRHPEIDEKCVKTGNCLFLTTESVNKFKESASLFLSEEIINIQQIELE